MGGQLEGAALQEQLGQAGQGQPGRMQAPAVGLKLLWPCAVLQTRWDIERAGDLSTGLAEGEELQGGELAELCREGQDTWGMHKFQVQAC